MNKLIIALIFISSTSFLSVNQNDETAVAAAVEQLRLAMVSGDRAALADIAAEQLSYGHSSGLIENKAEFVEKIASGNSDFVSITLSEQSIAISGKTAIVRQRLDAVTNDGGKPGEAHIKVLLVWQKQGKQWKLLARQAVKIV
jgi:ketosteroid isomerase-like protein